MIKAVDQYFARHTVWITSHGVPWLRRRTPSSLHPAPNPPPVSLYLSVPIGEKEAVLYSRSVSLPIRSAVAIAGLRRIHTPWAPSSTRPRSSTGHCSGDTEATWKGFIIGRDGRVVLGYSSTVFI